MESAECNQGDHFLSTHSVPGAVPGPGIQLGRSEASLVGGGGGASSNLKAESKADIEQVKCSLL